MNYILIAIALLRSSKFAEVVKLLPRGICIFLIKFIFKSVNGKRLHRGVVYIGRSK
jgi:hypothetical protein